LPHLLRFTAEHREEGLGLQNEVGGFEVELREIIDEIWTTAAEENGAIVPGGWASRMAEAERNKAVNLLEKVLKPDISQGKDWRVKLFDVK